jgi:serine/threonine-protein kinase
MGSTALSPGVARAPATRLPPAPAGYDLFVPLGGGGMGEVYLAREHFTERAVAIKFLRGPRSGSAQERFLVEVRALAALDHPNIVRVLATDFLRADPFFTMELADGGSLAKWVEDHGPLAPADAARLIATVARAVHVAHAAGILHRDLKPSNVLLKMDDSGSKMGPDGSRSSISSLQSAIPKVADFGLAKWLDHDDRLTVGSGPIGTPGYMPPEQVSRRNGEVAPASDTYGLGATLFHVLTGRPPFGPGDQAEVMQRVLTDPVPRVRAVRSEVPAELEGIVVKCLEKDPADRYPTAAALADDLDRFLGGRKPAAAPLTRWRRARRWVVRHRSRLAAVGLAVLLAAGLVGAGLAINPRPKQEDPPDPVAEIQKELAAGTRVTLVGMTGMPRWYEWRLTPSTLGPSARNDETVVFQSGGMTLLELLPDPGISRYRVSAEVLQERGDPIPNGGVRSESTVGLYFGYATYPGPTGWQFHSLFVVPYTDLSELPAPALRGIKPKPTQSIVQFSSLLLAAHPDRNPNTHWDRTGNVPFTPDPRHKWPGQWRRVEFEITPERIRTLWAESPTAAPQLVHELTEKEMVEWCDRMAQSSAMDVPGFHVITVWNPRLPFGIFCDRSTVAFRNVTIEPLP